MLLQMASAAIPLQQQRYFSEEESELGHMIKLNSMQSVLISIWKEDNIDRKMIISTPLTALHGDMNSILRNPSEISSPSD